MASWRNPWREKPISWANLESIAEVGKQERANTPLQGERELNILPAWAAEIQLQTNEEWADLLSPPSPSPSSLLSPPPSLPHLLSPSWSSSWTVAMQVSRSLWYHRDWWCACPQSICLTVVINLYSLPIALFMLLYLFHFHISLSLLFRPQKVSWKLKLLCVTFAKCDQCVKTQYHQKIPCEKKKKKITCSLRQRGLVSWQGKSVCYCGWQAGGD